MGNADTRKGFPGMPFDDREGCVAAVSGDAQVDDPEAFCAWLEEQGDEALSDPHAEEVLSGLQVEFVSAVDTPAQDSEWVIAKNAEGPDGQTHRWKAQSEFYTDVGATGGNSEVRAEYAHKSVEEVQDDYAEGDLSDAELEPALEAAITKDSGEKQIAFAPVLIPGEADKQGDVIPEFEIEKAAHGYLANHRKVDADHDLFDGKGVPVESWTLKQSLQFTKPDGTESRKYPKGTWFMGVKFDDDTWSRVKDGDLNGFSIFGGAKPVEVGALLGKADTSGVPGTTESVAMAKDDKSNMEKDGKEKGADDAPDDDESVIKEMGAEGVSAMLSEFSDMVDNGGLSRDATVEDFVRSLIQDGSVEEGQVTGLSVFLGGDGGGDDDEMPDEDDEDDDGEGDDSELSLSDDDADAEDDAAKADDPDDGDVEKSADAPEWADDLVDKVDSVADRVDDLEKKVDDVPDAARMELDENDRLSTIKSLFGDEDMSDEEAEVLRKGVVEQVGKSDDDGFDGVDFGGITDGENADAEATGTKNDDGDSGQSVAQNKRMAVDN